MTNYIDGVRSSFAGLAQKASLKLVLPYLRPSAGSPSARSSSRACIMPTLRDRPSHRASPYPRSLREAFTFLSQARQSALLGLFLDALTRGGPSGLPRPIELHAHDPLRYIGDMLAWVHQAIAAECEMLESLFGISGSARMVGAVRTFNGSEEEEWIRDLLNAIVGKLCMPLKVSIRTCPV